MLDLSNQTDEALINQLYELAYSHVIARAIQLAVELKLDELLQPASPVTLENLAKAFALSKTGTYKFIRLLDSYQLVKLADDNTVVATKATVHLAKLRSPHILLNYPVIGELKTVFQKNQEGFSDIYGKDFYSTIYSDEELTQAFEKWCTASAKAWLPTVLNCYDFSPFTTVADLGGGAGWLIALLLQTYSHQHGILLDKPEIIQQASRVLNDYQVQERTTLVCGDFFDRATLPTHQDAYILCRTLLNWSDQHALDIIENCYAVMDKGATCLIIDFFIPPKTDARYQRSLASDTVLLALMSSANRTLSEWEQLVQQSSFEHMQFFYEKETSGCSFMPFIVLELKK